MQQLLHQSSPTNDRLVYLTAGEVVAYLDELQATKSAAAEIAFTGGEPFMNPYFMSMIFKVPNAAIRVDFDQCHASDDEMRVGALRPSGHASGIRSPFVSPWIIIQLRSTIFIAATGHLRLRSSD